MVSIVILNNKFFVRTLPKTLTGIATIFNVIVVQAKEIKRDMRLKKGLKVLKRQ